MVVLLLLAHKLFSNIDLEIVNTSVMGIRITKFRDYISMLISNGQAVLLIILCKLSKRIRWRCFVFFAHA